LVIKAIVFGYIRLKTVVFVIDLQMFAANGNAIHESVAAGAAMNSHLKFF